MDKRLIKRVTFVTEGTAYTVTGKLWDEYVNTWTFVFGYLYESLIGDSLAKLQSYYAKAPLADYNVHIWFFGGVGHREIN